MRCLVCRFLGRLWEFLLKLFRCQRVTGTITFINEEGVHTVSTGTMRVDSAGLFAEVLFRDAKGNEVEMRTPPRWSSSDTSIATVEVTDDGMAATILPVGPAGECDIDVIAEDETTPEVHTVTATGHVVVVPAEAVSAELSFVPA